MRNVNRRSSTCPRPSFAFRVPLFVLFFASGCGAPGEPVAPAPLVPVAITDLSAHQAGDAVQLAFTLPAKTVKGEPLPEPPAVEILRGTLKPDGSQDSKSFRVIFTIPGAMADRYRAADKLEFPDHILPADLRDAPHATFVYRVRTRASRKRPSADSNTATQTILPVPQPIPHLEAKVTPTAIDLTWQPPQRDSAGKALSNITRYHIYRGQLDPSSAADAQSDLSQAKWISPLTLLSGSATNSFSDTTFDFEKIYLYTVRSVTTVDNKQRESSDSTPAIVTPHDTFPPALPQGLVANVVNPTPEAAPEVDLSWSINLEPDLAGYRVYRSEQEGTSGQLVTPELLLSPAYRDTSVEPGHRYWYSVTSLDRSGNESAPCAPVVVDIAQPSS